MNGPDLAAAMLAEIERIHAPYIEGSHAASQDDVCVTCLVVAPCETVTAARRLMAERAGVAS